MKKALSIVAALVIAPSIASAAQLSAQLGGAVGAQGLASVVTTDGDVNYSFITNGIGNVTGASVAGSALGASSNNGSDAGTALGISASVGDTITVNGSNGSVSGTLQLVSENDGDDGDDGDDGAPQCTDETGDTVLTTRDGRQFRVRLCSVDDRIGPTNDDPFAANPIPFSDVGVVYYWNNPGNPECLIKVLNGCGFSENPRYWVFASCTTDVGFVLTVTDLAMDETATYTNAQGSLAAPIADTSALATCQ